MEASASDFSKLLTEIARKRALRDRERAAVTVDALPPSPRTPKKAHVSVENGGLCGKEMFSLCPPLGRGRFVDAEILRALTAAEAARTIRFMNNRRRIIPPRHGIEVVVEDGCISILQIDDGFQSDEPVVVRFHPNDVAQLVEFLDDALVERSHPAGTVTNG